MGTFINVKLTCRTKYSINIADNKTHKNNFKYKIGYRQSVVFISSYQFMRV